MALYLSLEQVNDNFEGCRNFRLCKEKFAFNVEDFKDWMRRAKLRNYTHSPSISIFMVDDTGIEPVTPSMSRKCATAALIVRIKLRILSFKFIEVETGFEPV